MGELLMATPAFAGDTMFVRGVEHLFAIRSPRSSARGRRH